MSFEDVFDDSLDEILADITASQLDPSLGRHSNNERLSRQICCETQTDWTMDCRLKNSLKRKKTIIATAKHHHKPCALHDDNHLANCNSKRTKLEISSNDNDITEDNLQTIPMSLNGRRSSQFVLIEENENNGEDVDDSTQLETEELIESMSRVSSQKTIPIISDSDFESDSLDSDLDELHLNRSNRSMPLFDELTDEDSDVCRSPLAQLNINDNNRPALRPSQHSLIDDQDLIVLKTQNSQNSNSSQRSAICG